MLVNRTPAGCVRQSRGFSLLEVVIAAVLLLVTVIAVTGAVSSVSRAGRRAEGVAHSEQVLGSVLAHFASLPMCPSRLPATTGRTGSTAGDLVTAVFPHADGGPDSPAARYVPADEDGLPGGSFVTRFEQDGVDVVCVARFRAGVAGGWLRPDDLAGWSVESSGRLPAAVLAVDVTAARQGVERSGSLLREAGVDLIPVPDPGATVLP